MASRELGKAKRSIEAIRNFYKANLILCAIVTGALAMFGAAPVVLALAGGATVFMCVGMLQIANKPFEWSLAIAVIWTLIMGAHAYGGGLGPNLTTFLGGAWTLGCWIMLPTTRRVNRLLGQYPDLWVAKKMRNQRSAPTRRRH